jgi:hypothetical protein
MKSAHLYQTVELYINGGQWAVCWRMQQRSGFPCEYAGLAKAVGEKMSRVTSWGLRAQESGYAYLIWHKVRLPARLPARICPL